MSSVEDFASDLEFVNGEAGGADVSEEGRCVFKVNKDMHFEALSINNACCAFFKTEKERHINMDYRIDEHIYPEDKSSVFQAIGMAMATKKPINLIIRVKTEKDRFIACRFSAQISRYDESGCPVFHATFIEIASLVKKQI